MTDSGSQLEQECLELAATFKEAFSIKFVTDDPYYGAGFYIPTKGDPPSIRHNL